MSNTTIINRKVVATNLLARGPAGKSAYESYVATTSDDPVLSEVDWQASLKGEDGAPGPAPEGTGWVSVVDGELQTPRALESADIGDASATPIDGKVALWETTLNYDAERGAGQGEYLALAPRQLQFIPTVPYDTNSYLLSEIGNWFDIGSGAPATRLPTSFDFVSINGNATDTYSGAVHGRFVEFGFGLGTIEVFARDVNVVAISASNYTNVTVHCETCTIAPTGVQATFGAGTIYGNVINVNAHPLTNLTIYGLINGKLKTSTGLSDIYDATRHNLLTGTPAQARAEIMGATGAEIAAAGTVSAARGAQWRYAKTKENTVTHTNNGTFANDAEITHTLEANTVYKVEGQILFDAPVGGGGFKATFIPPSLAITGAGGNGWGNVSKPDGTTIPVTYNVIATNGFGLYGETTARTGRPISFVFFFKTGATGGAMPLQTAQQSSSATSTTVLPGTTVIYEKIG